MGCSWSSYVAQGYLLQRCYAAGFDEDAFLADGKPAPSCMDQVYGLATDYLVIFTRNDAAKATESTRDFDSELDRAGVIRAPAKDVTAEVSHSGVTCVGVDVSDGTFLVPSRNKLGLLLVGTAHLLTSDTEITPDGLAALLGHKSWFAQLSRPLYSCFLVVYDFARRSNNDVPQKLPSACACELLTFLLLAPVLEADLRRPWLTTIVACDASSVFGFGVAVADVTADDARRVGRFADVAGSYVRVDRSVPHPNDEDERPRVGTRQELGLSKHHFRPVIAQRAKFKAHSGALEATGVSLAVKWVLRDRRRHGKRVALLVDAQAVLGAAARGRSSAKTFGREIKRLAALVLGGDLLVRYVYIPSEDNPGDAPSRNKHVRTAGGRFDKRGQKAARRDRQWRAVQQSNCCPGCGVALQDHPLHVPKRLRGGSVFCRQHGKFGYCFRNGVWDSEIDDRIGNIMSLDDDDPYRRSFLSLGL